MSNELMEFNQDQLCIIKNMFCSNATDMEFKLFIEMSKSLGLDPKKKEIHFVKYGSGDNAKPTMIVGIDGYRKIADRTGRYMPGREPTYTYKNNNLFSATSYVKKLGPDKEWHEVAATAMFSEYNTGKGPWTKMPHIMLAKCAEAAALRRAFTSELSGTYTEDEMQQAIELPVNKHTGEISIKSETISIDDAIKLANLVGDDEQFKNRMFSEYKVKDYSELPLSSLNRCLFNAEMNAKRNLEKEMEAVND